MKRDYIALKKEGEMFAPDGYVFIGMGNLNYPLKIDWLDSEVYSFEGHLLFSGSRGISSCIKYFVRTEDWNNKHK